MKKKKKWLPKEEFMDKKRLKKLKLDHKADLHGAPKGAINVNSDMLMKEFSKFANSKEGLCIARLSVTNSKQLGRLSF